MIVKTLTTTHGKVKVHIPENLNEVTLGQMLAMEQLTEEDTHIPMIPELTKEIADNITDVNQLQEIQQRILSLAHQIKYSYNEKAIPEFIIFGTKKVKRFGFTRTVPNKIKVMRNLSIEPAGAYLSSRDIIATEINKHTEMYGEENWQQNFVPSIDTCASILANYFYCRVTGELYNEQAAEAFKEEVLKLSVQETLPVARFFFLNSSSLYRPRMSLLQLLRMKLNERRVLRNIKNSNTTTQ